MMPSQLTRGKYFNAQNEQDLRKVYQELDPQLVIKTENMEVTSILAGVSLSFLLIGGLLSLLWFGRIA